MPMGIVFTLDKLLGGNVLQKCCSPLAHTRSLSDISCNVVLDWTAESPIVSKTCHCTSL